jgi:hypothetical protein
VIDGATARIQMTPGVLRATLAQAPHPHR